MAAKQTEEIGETNEVSSTLKEDPVIAKPSGACCLQGSIHEGEARGETTTIAGVETYVSEPQQDKANGHILLYFPDVYGLFNNGFLIMDGFADAGYKVVGLDYFRGVRRSDISSLPNEIVDRYQDPVWKHRKYRGDTTTEPDFDFEAWKDKHMAFAVETVPTWVAEVKSKYGKPDTKFACVG